MAASSHSSVVIPSGAVTSTYSNEPSMSGHMSRERMKQITATSNNSAMGMMMTMYGRLWDAVGQIVVLPFVCVSVCGVVGMLVVVHCIERMERALFVFAWQPSTNTLDDADDMHSVMTCNKPVEVAGASTFLYCQRDGKHTIITNGTGSTHDRDDNERNDRVSSDGNDATTSRSPPLKKQRSEDGSDFMNSSTSSSTLGESLIVDDTAKLTAKLKHTKRRVYIWDLDETLVLFASLYTGTFAQAHGLEIAKGVLLGEQMMTFLLAMLERHFFFSELHDSDIDHIACLDAMKQQYDHDQVHHTIEHCLEATSNLVKDSVEHQCSVHERYARIRAIYERHGHVDFLNDAANEGYIIREHLLTAIDSFSTGWLREAREILDLIKRWNGPTRITSDNKGSQRLGVRRNTHSLDSKHDAKDNQERQIECEYENINVMVTNTQLAPALCKCLIYQLDRFFPIDTIYSSSKLRKRHCFETIMNRYNAPDVEFIAIGDGAEEEQVSEALGIEFHKVRCVGDLKRLRYDLNLVDDVYPALGSIERHEDDNDDAV